MCLPGMRDPHHSYAGGGLLGNGTIGHANCRESTWYQFSVRGPEAL